MPKPFFPSLFWMKECFPWNLIVCSYFILSFNFYVVRRPSQSSFVFSFSCKIGGRIKSSCWQGASPCCVLIINASSPVIAAFL
uniref:Uncharacterized protein n=1 Tax=Nelumbo nucifera TaxID=4432 RepID=A0A822ZAL1_NELNU|nr:TPA_asm: hypothetical protein HUJ06_015903 [Nelumbo nucifera]